MTRSRNCRTFRRSSPRRRFRSQAEIVGSIVASRELARREEIKAAEARVVAADLEENRTAIAITEYAERGNPRDSKTIRELDEKHRIAKERSFAANQQLHALRGPVWEHEVFGWIRQDDPQDPVLRQVPAPIRRRPAPAAPARRALPQSIRRTPRQRQHRSTASRPTAIKAASSPPGSTSGSDDPDPPIDKTTKAHMGGQGKAA